MNDKKKFFFLFRLFTPSIIQSLPFLWWRATSLFIYDKSPACNASVELGARRFSANENKRYVESTQKLRLEIYTSQQLYYHLGENSFRSAPSLFLSLSRRWKRGSSRVIQWLRGRFSFLQKWTIESCAGFYLFSDFRMIKSLTFIFSGKKNLWIKTRISFTYLQYILRVLQQRGSKRHKRMCVLEEIEGFT